LKTEIADLNDLRVATVGEFQVDSQAALDLLRMGCRDRLGQVTVKAGPANRRSAVISGNFGWGSLALAIAGPEFPEAELLDAAQRLENLAIDLAGQVGLAWVSLEPDLSLALTAFPFRDDGRSLQVVADLLDVVLFDAYPFQILGPGHLQRLGETPKGAEPLSGRRVKLALGRLHEWQPGQPVAQLQRTEGRRILASCLPDIVEVGRLRKGRWPPRHQSSQNADG
jgi:hypothetical protein